jgi:hypothetical protein
MGNGLLPSASMLAQAALTLPLSLTCEAIPHHHHAPPTPNSLVLQASLSMASVPKEDSDDFSKIFEWCIKHSLNNCLVLLKQQQAHTPEYLKSNMPNIKFCQERNCTT